MVADLDQVSARGRHVEPYRALVISLHGQCRPNRMDGCFFLPFAIEGYPLRGICDRVIVVVY